MDTMTKKQMRECAHQCPVEVVTALVGGKWKVVILYYLMTNKMLRFGELRRLMPGVTQKMLTNQLRELEKDRLVDRKVYPVVPPKVEYSLTSLGQSLSNIIHEMNTWGEHYIQATTPLN
jgi:DNA-binding HxlR family transcriptional regulator